MKINSSIPPGQIQAPTLDGRHPAGKAADSPEQTGATKVSLSSDASFISSLQQQSREMPAIREDVVAGVRQAIEDGSFEQSVDMDAVVDGLMADL